MRSRVRGLLPFFGGSRACRFYTSEARHSPGVKTAVGAWPRAIIGRGPLRRGLEGFALGGHGEGASPRKGLKAGSRVDGRCRIPSHPRVQHVMVLRPN